MKKITLIKIIFLLLLVSCKEKPKQERPELTIEADITGIESSFSNWWVYQNQNIDLSSDFIAFNANREEIQKEEFFQTLNSGNYIPIMFKNTGDNKLKYSLHRLGENADKEIQIQIKRLSKEHFTNFKKIGTKFPDFKFEDLEGNFYSNDKLKGKIIVVKTWFIACKPCIKEFPELNQLVEKYKNNGDIVFLSLALDQKEELEKFLSEKPFNYKVIPNQKDFIHDKLKTNKFPTHIVIDKKGNYHRIPSDAYKLVAYINNANIETQSENRMPPPPPASKN